MKYLKHIWLFAGAIFILLSTEPAAAQAGKLSTAFKIKEKDLIPEGITYDPVKKIFYVSSIHKHKIVTSTINGISADFTPSGTGGLYCALGMKTDAFRRILWVCSYAGPEFGSQKGFAAVFKYNMDSGRLIKKYMMDNKKGNHLFNDIAVTADGDAYFTDTETGAVFKINHLSDRIEPFLREGSLRQPNGIALSPDGTRLFIADSAGISIARLNGDIKRMKTENKIFAGGIDGLYYYKGSLIGIQNDVEPIKIVRLKMNNELDAIENMEILSVNNPLVSIPTTGVIAGNKFYFIANSQLDLLRNGKITDYSKLEDVSILCLEL